MMSNDINLDGQLNIDGFKSSILKCSELSDYKITLEELPEIFNLVSVGGDFRYAEYIIDIDPRNRAYFTKLNLAAADES